MDGCGFIFFHSYTSLGSHVYVQGNLGFDPLIYASYIVGMTGICHPTQLFAQADFQL
jgi:hypothetical protein